MIRKRCYLDEPQAKAVVQIFRRSQLNDLVVFLRILNRTKQQAYQLGLDCPEDSFARLSAKLEDVSNTLVLEDQEAILSLEWETYED
tara:strand:+ start:430 stop:690 length:261 start_codon:yes stop_codon:yes gene_type:complete